MQTLRREHLDAEGWYRRRWHANTAEGMSAREQILVLQAVAPQNRAQSLRKDGTWDDGMQTLRREKPGRKQVLTLPAVAPQNQAYALRKNGTTPC